MTVSEVEESAQIIKPIQKDSVSEGHEGYNNKKAKSLPCPF